MPESDGNVIPEVPVLRAAAIVVAANAACSFTSCDTTHASLTEYPNLLVGLDRMEPRQAWGGNSTYVRLRPAFVDVAYGLDGWSRRCVGWHLARTIDTHLTLAALEAAIGVR